MEEAGVLLDEPAPLDELELDELDELDDESELPEPLPDVLEPPDELELSDELDDSVVLVLVDDDEPFDDPARLSVR